MSAVRRHPLIAFLVLTYALTWGVLPLGIFGVAGPLVAALIVIAITDGRAGLRELGSRMIRWRFGWALVRGGHRTSAGGPLRACATRRVANASTGNETTV